MKKIVLIDDDPQIVRLLEDHLTALGYSVTTAADGESGFALVCELKPALVITDLMMPVAHGFDVCHRIHTDPALAGTRVLVISAKHFEIDKRTALRIGADKYLVKPFPLEELSRAVAELIGPAGEA